LNDVSLLAVHISDGPLEPVALAIGFIVAGLLLVPAVWRVEDDEIPRIALLTAAFFVSSSIHIRFGPTTVHLILNALVGVVLGRRAPLAIAVGLVLHVVLLGHGGYSTLGVNASVISLPALLARAAFPLLAGRRPSRTRAMIAAGTIGWATVVLTAALNAAILIFGGIEDWQIVAATMFGAYMVLAVVEGLILGLTAGYLVRVKPDLLGLSPSRPN
jgi:cobalt/nickel transport system permease protein